MRALLVPFSLLICLPTHHFAQRSQYAVSGKVSDAKSRDGLASAIVRVLNSSRGTVCNSEGVYRLLLEEGNHRLVVSSLGYGTDTIQINVAGNVTLDFLLAPSGIVLQEILVTGEDPAYAIIRKAIENKHRWTERLHSYEMDAFTRQVLRRDTAIASITEAFTKGYWRERDTLREVSLHKRQTENIEASFNFASVGRLLNFYDDNIRFIGYSFAGPIADDAFDHYRYKLLKTLQSAGHELYEIEITPLSQTVPRFKGTVSIAGGTFALVGVDVEPNQAFLLPFVKEKFIRYRQQFRQFEQTFWLPADIRIDARFTIGIPGLSFPRIGFAQTSVITDYRINIPLPDSIFVKPRLTVDSTATSYDSSAWSGPDILPLTAEETLAYTTLDSTKTLDVQFRPGGIAMTFGGDSSAASAAIDIVDLSFNRVEGAHLGLKYASGDLLPTLSFQGGFAYGFSDKATKYYGGLTLFSSEEKSFGVGVERYKDLETVPEQGYYGTEFNSLTTLFLRNDYSDYYYREGWSAFVSLKPNRLVQTKLVLFHEKHSGAEVNTNFSVFHRSQPFRPNPSRDEGNLRAIRWELYLGREPVPFDVVAHHGLDLSIEYSSRDLLKSDYDFVRYEAVGTVIIPTFGRRFLSQPGFRLRIAAGTSTDWLPRQRMFSIESASSGFAPFGVMKGMNVKEFVGTRYVAVNIEHNFRSIPFLALDIPELYENNIELIIHAGAARICPPVTIMTTGAPGPLFSESSHSWYTEAGIGISRIFELIRCDFTWRLSNPRFFRITVGVANLL